MPLRKTWELRPRPGDVDGQTIALFELGERRIVGVVDVIQCNGCRGSNGCCGPFNLRELRPHFAEHRVPPKELREFLTKWNDRAFAFALTHPRRLREPVEFRVKQGTQDWIKRLPPRVVREIERQI